MIQTVGSLVADQGLVTGIVADQEQVHDADPADQHPQNPEPSIVAGEHEILACRERRIICGQEEYRMGVTLAAIRRDRFGVRRSPTGVRCWRRPRS